MSAPILVFSFNAAFSYMNAVICFTNRDCHLGIRPADVELKSVRVTFFNIVDVPNCCYKRRAREQ